MNEQDIIYKESAALPFFKLYYCKVSLLIFLSIYAILDMFLYLEKRKIVIFGNEKDVSDK